jgi:periplasmic copper chaperone A
MKLTECVFALLAVAMATTSTAEQSEKLAPLPKVTEVWVKTTVPGSTVSAAYMHIKSATPMKLMKVESPAAGIVEIHDMKMNDGVMQMNALDAIDISANTPVELKPGGMHVMLMKVKKPISKGDKVPLVLIFKSAGNQPVVVKIDAIAQESNMAGHKH